MTIPATIIVQIDRFCNCQGCIDKVKKALYKFADVRLLAMDPEIGKFTILTAKHPQVIEYALKHAFPKKNINIIVPYPHVNLDLDYAPLLPPPPRPPQANIMPSAPPIPASPDLVYGYPPEFYGFEDDPRGCCPIL